MNPNTDQVQLKQIMKAHPPITAMNGASAMNDQNELFTNAFDKITKTIPFNRAWSNQTGQFDFAVYGEHAPTVGNAQAVKAMTPSGRRIIIIGTRLGLLVVYDRYAQQQPGGDKAHKAVFARNTTSAVEHGGWFHNPTFDDIEMAVAVGDEHEENLGRRIEQLHSALKKTA